MKYKLKIHLKIQDLPKMLGIVKLILMFLAKLIHNNPQKTLNQIQKPPTLLLKLLLNNWRKISPSKLQNLHFNQPNLNNKKSKIQQSQKRAKKVH